MRIGKARNAATKPILQIACRVREYKPPYQAEQKLVTKAYTYSAATSTPFLNNAW